MKNLIFIIFLAACSSSPFKNKEAKLETLPAAADTTVKELPKKKAVAKNKAQVVKVASTEEVKMEEKPQEKETNNLNLVPWKSGEELKYEVNALGFDAAEIRIKVEGIKELRGKAVWHFKMEGKTTGFASKMFYYSLASESFMNDKMQSMQFQSSSFEGKTSKESLEQYLPEKNSYYVFKKRDGKVEKEKTQEFDLSKPYTDAIGFFFRLRTLKAGESIRVLSNHKVKLLTVEKITTENVEVGDNTYYAEKLHLKYDGKDQAIWREKVGAKRILKGDISMSFASGTLTLKNP